MSEKSAHSSRLSDSLRSSDSDNDSSSGESEISIGSLAHKPDLQTLLQNKTVFNYDPV
jgi:hypothetical protein